MVDYPSYMQTVHSYWLDGTGSISTGGVAKEITTALTANPFTALTSPDPATDTTAMGAAITAFEAVISGIDPHTSYDDLYAAAVALVDALLVPDTYIDARTAAHANLLDVEIDTKVIPRFEAGMRDINAVQSSAFVIGRAIIELDRNDKVDKFAADLRYQADVKRTESINSVTSEMTRILLQKTEFQRVIAALTLDYRRLKIAAQNDYHTETKALAADDARWNLEVYKYGANLLAGIGGGTTSSVAVDGNKTARILGSGLSGAVAGAMAGGQIAGSEGAGYGAIIGGLLGAFGAS